MKPRDPSPLSSSELRALLGVSGATLMRLCRDLLHPPTGVGRTRRLDNLDLMQLRLVGHLVNFGIQRGVAALVALEVGAHIWEAVIADDDQIVDRAGFHPQRHWLVVQLDQEADGWWVTKVLTDLELAEVVKQEQPIGTTAICLSTIAREVMTAVAADRQHTRVRQPT